MRSVFAVDGQTHSLQIGVGGWKTNICRRRRGKSCGRGDGGWDYKVVQVHRVRWTSPAVGFTGFSQLSNAAGRGPLRNELWSSGVLAKLLRFIVL